MSFAGRVIFTTKQVASISEGLDIIIDFFTPQGDTQILQQIFDSWGLLSNIVEPFTWDSLCHYILIYFALVRDPTKALFLLKNSHSDLALILTKPELIIIQIEIRPEIVLEVEICLSVLIFWEEGLLAEWLDVSIRRDEVVVPVFDLGE